MYVHIFIELHIYGNSLKMKWNELKCYIKCSKLKRVFISSQHINGLNAFIDYQNLDVFSTNCIVSNESSQIILDQYKIMCDIVTKNKNKSIEIINYFVLGSKNVRNDIYQNFETCINNIGILKNKHINNINSTIAIYTNKTPSIPHWKTNIKFKLDTTNMLVYCDSWNHNEWHLATKTDKKIGINPKRSLFNYIDS